MYLFQSLLNVKLFHAAEYTTVYNSSFSYKPPKSVLTASNPSCNKMTPAPVQSPQYITS